MAKTPLLLEWMRDQGLDAYGSVIPGEQVRAFLELDMPEVGTKQEFDAVALKELNAIGAVRGALLKEGKYLEGERGDYRILLPSENAKQIDAYHDAAIRKIKCAQLLSKNTPTQQGGDVQSVARRKARLHMLSESLDSGKRRAARTGGGDKLDS